MRSWWARMARWWKKQSLTLQFALATSAILLVGMLMIGRWMAERISEAVIHSHAVSAALYADSFIEPRVQALATGTTLSAEDRRSLDALLLPQAIGEPVVGFRIWKGDTVVYSDRAELIGRTLPPSPRRIRAWAGEVSAEYEYLEPDHGPRNPTSQPVLEIYAPVRRAGASEIIALAETYQLAPTLPDDLAKARRGSWLVVAGIASAMILLQLLVVSGGSRTIDRQREALKERIGELSRLLDENTVLRHRSNDASRRVTELNEINLRRFGSDLHDGPVQLLGSAVLRLDALSEVLSGADKAIVAEAQSEIAVLGEAIGDALSEIRNISAGLGPPDIEKLSLAGTLETAGRRHERRTGSTVKCQFDGLQVAVPQSLKSTLFRFVQEGLSNAYRHAGGRGQAVSARIVGDRLLVEVTDQGPGIDGEAPVSLNSGQGLVGLRDRIESLGGEFEVGPGPGGGVKLTARFELPAQATMAG